MSKVIVSIGLDSEIEQKLRGINKSEYINNLLKKELIDIDTLEQEKKEYKQRIELIDKTIKEIKQKKEIKLEGLKERLKSIKEILNRHPERYNDLLHIHYNLLKKEYGNYTLEEIKDLLKTI